MKYVPCNTVEKLCPLPRPRRRLRRPPVLLALALLGSSRARPGVWLLSLHQFIFLAPAHLTVGQLTQ